jgi:arylsulfatase A-like enzyme
MHRSTFLIVLVFSFVCTSVESSSIPSGDERPNVIIIICDDLNDSVEGFGGHPQAITPNMDRLANRGVKFLNAHCNVPVCGPSRASIWSGLYPHTTGNFGYRQQENPWYTNPTLKNSVTVFEHMTAGGYTVFATGKIHHNGHEKWEIFNSTTGTSGFKVEPSMGPYPAGEIHEYLGRGNTHPDLPEGMRGVGWDSGFGPIRDISDAYNQTGHWKYKYSLSETYHYKSPDDRDLMPDERSTDYVIGLLREAHDKPFFITIGLNRPHSPMHVPENYFEMYPINSIQLSMSMADDLLDCAPTFRDLKDVGTGNYSFEKFNYIMDSGGLEALKAWTRAYLACVTFVDDQVGRILDALEESAYANNTIIIFTSDHGYHMGEKEQLFKNSVWEESTRVPFVISGPGIVCNASATVPISLIDVFPTLIDYCNLTPHPNAGTNGYPLDGFSLRGLLENPVAGKWDGPRIALTAVASGAKLETNEPGPRDQQHYSVRGERFRYIICRNGDEELYDHLVDPYEWHNLASNKAFDHIKQELRAEFSRLLNE